MADQKQEKHNFHAVIPWHKLEKHFRKMDYEIRSWHAQQTETAQTVQTSEVTPLDDHKATRYTA